MESVDARVIDNELAFGGTEPLVKFRAPGAFNHRALRHHIAKNRAIGDYVGVIRPERNAHGDDRNLHRAREREQTSRARDEGLAGALVVADAELYPAVRVNDFVLIMQGDQRGRHDAGRKLSAK